MLRPRMLIGSMVFLLGTTGAAMGSKPASAQEQTSTTTASADTRPIKKLGKMDVSHPLRVGSDYYPKQSLKNHEQGKCTLAFYIEADGTVPAAQLLKSTGFPRLDTACFESVIGVPLIPATINGSPVAG
jgi:TonB family protein